MTQQEVSSPNEAYYLSAHQEKSLKDTLVDVFSHARSHTEHCVCSSQRIDLFFSTVTICLLEVYMLSFQKLNDNREQVIKKRKKKEVNNMEEKNPKKNKVPKQGWGSL